MSRNVDFISHKKSKLKNQDGSPKLPLASALLEGEIAINFAKDVETISIKNESGDVVTFSSDNYYTDKKLGSGFTGANSAVTVTEALENVLIDVDQVIDSTTSASTNAVSTKAVYDTIADNELVWTNAFVELSGTVAEHTSDSDVHITSADRLKLDSITGDVGTMAYENISSYSSATEVYNALLTKADVSSVPSVDGYADSVMYNSTRHYVEFYHGTTAGTKVFEYDASQFIIDGMVDNVEIKNVTSGESQVTCLVVSFNTDAGKQDINIPISNIFNADNYYTKSQTSGSTELSTAFGTKVNSATYTAHTANTNAHFSGNEKENLDSLSTNIATISGISSSNVTSWDDAATNSHSHSNKTYLDGITGNVGTMAYENTSSYSSATQVNTALGNKLDLSVFSAFSASTNESIDDLSGQSETIAAALVYLEENKLDSSAYTPTDLTNYYTKSQTSGATELSTAFGTKVNSGTFNSHTGNSSIHFTTGDVQTQIDNSISGKVNVSDVITAITPSNSGSTNPIATNVVAENELIVSSALNDLSEGKLDKSAFIYSSVTVASNLSNVTCPTEITGTSKSGAQAIVIYVNNGTTTDYTVTVSTSYKSPDGQQISLNCPKNGYCEVSYLNIDGTIYARGI